MYLIFFPCLKLPFFFYDIEYPTQSTKCILITSALPCANGVCCIVNLWTDRLLRSLHIKNTITTIATITTIIMTLNIIISCLANCLICVQGFTYQCLALYKYKTYQSPTYILENRGPIYPGYLTSCTLGDYSYIYSLGSCKGYATIKNCLPGFLICLLMKQV